jgi:hypothetical protein
MTECNAPEEVMRRSARNLQHGLGTVELVADELQDDPEAVSRLLVEFLTAQHPATEDSLQPSAV